MRSPDVPSLHVGPVLCHNKPHLMTLCVPALVCSFYRSNIMRLAVANAKVEKKRDKEKENNGKSRRSPKTRHSSEGSSSFKGVSSAMGALGKVGRCVGKVPDTGDMGDKP